MANNPEGIELKKLNESEALMDSLQANVCSGWNVRYVDNTVVSLRHAFPSRLAADEDREGQERYQPPYLGLLNETLTYFVD